VSDQLSSTRRHVFTFRFKQKLLLAKRYKGTYTELHQ